MARKSTVETDLSELMGSDKTESNGTGKDPFEDEMSGASLETEFEFDFSDTGSVANGRYPARVADFGKETSSTGNPMFVWQFSLPTIGRKIPFWTPLQPAARWKAAETLHAVGIEGEAMKKFKRQDVVGRPCIVDIENGMYEGTMRPKIKKVYPANAETLQALELP